MGFASGTQNCVWDARNWEIQADGGVTGSSKFPKSTLQNRRNDDVDAMFILAKIKCPHEYQSTRGCNVVIISPKFGKMGMSGNYQHTA